MGKKDKNHPMNLLKFNLEALKEGVEEFVALNEKFISAFDEGNLKEMQHIFGRLRIEFPVTDIFMAMNRAIEFIKNRR